MTACIFQLLSGENMEIKYLLFDNTIIQSLQLTSYYNYFKSLDKKVETASMNLLPANSQWP